MKFILGLLRYDTDECIFWPFAKTKSGYGHFRINYKNLYAHREVCRLYRGDPPEPDSIATHICGKGHKGCVNKKHLKWGTHKSNSEDTVNHGTFGARAKLTPDNVLEIRKSAKAGADIRKYVDKFGVTFPTVERAANYESWKHLP